jgi:uncharacterized membrane protein YqhA
MKKLTVTSVVISVICFFTTFMNAQSSSGNVAKVPVFGEVGLGFG